MKPLKKKSTDEQVADLFDGLLDGMYANFEKTAKQFETKSIPLELVKMYHDIIKKNYRAGVTGKKK